MTITDRRLPGSRPARLKSPDELLRDMIIRIRIALGGPRLPEVIEDGVLILHEDDGSRIEITTARGQWHVSLVTNGQVRVSQDGFGAKVPEMVRTARELNAAVKRPVESEEPLVRDVLAAVTGPDFVANEGTQTK